MPNPPAKRGRPTIHQTAMLAALTFQLASKHERMVRRWQRAHDCSKGEAVRQMIEIAAAGLASRADGR